MRLPPPAILLAPAFALVMLAAPAGAQTAPAGAARLDFPSVAAALQALEARDGNGTVVTRSEGWTVVNEPLAAAQWSFPPAQHAAYPAVVRRIIKRTPDGKVAIETASLCEAPEAACAALLAEFAALDERITQSARARGRQGSTPPPATPN